MNRHGQKKCQKSFTGSHTVCGSYSAQSDRRGLKLCAGGVTSQFQLSHYCAALACAWMLIRRCVRVCMARMGFGGFYRDGLDTLTWTETQHVLQPILTEL